MQDSFVSVWRYAHSFDPSRGSAMAWLARIVRNRCIDHLRQRGREVPLDPEFMQRWEDPTSSPADLAALSQDARRLWECLDELEESPRKILLLVYYEGMTYDEAADRVGSSARHREELGPAQPGPAQGLHGTMNYSDPEQRDRLAAEYALGTMRGPARQRFERLLSGNADLRDLAQDWELRVNLLAESAPAVEPPAHVWEGIARRVGPASAPAPLPESRRNWLWDSLGFWRGAAALAAAAAAALAFYVALQPPGPAPAQIAALDQRLTGIETRLAAVDATRARSAHSSSGSHASRAQLRAWQERPVKSPLSATAWPASQAGSMRSPPCRPTWACCSTRTSGR